MSSTVETAIESVPSTSTFRTRSSPTSAGGSRPRAGPRRRPSQIESQGVPLATMQELARYWATEYDWRRCEAKLNALPQFMTEIDGLDIHFIHVRSEHEDALPLIVNARMARLDHRAAEDHRSARRSHGTRRERLGRLPRGDPVDAGLRVLRQADEHRLGPRAHGPSLGGADDSASATPATSPRAATGVRSSSTRWACRRLRDCSPSTPTCLPPFRLTSTRRSWPATRRHPVSQPRNDAPTSSWSGRSSRSTTPG